MLASLNHTIPKPVTLLLLIVMTSASFISPAEADVVTTEALSQQAGLESKREQVRGFVARESLQERLLQLGVQPAELESRIDAMTDQEILELQEGIETLAAGQGVLELAIGLLVIFMVLDMAGVTDIFPAV